MPLPIVIELTKSIVMKEGRVAISHHRKCADHRRSLHADLACGGVSVSSASGTPVVPPPGGGFLRNRDQIQTPTGTRTAPHSHDIPSKSFLMYSNHSLAVSGQA